MIVILRFIFSIFCAIIPFFHFYQYSVVASIIAAVVGLVLSIGFLILFEYVSHTFSIRVLLAALFGLFSGYVLSFLIIIGLDFMVPTGFEWYLLVRAAVYHLVTFFTVFVFAINHESIAFFDKIVPPDTDNCEGMVSYKILDTSVIIDGRIADICDTGFIEGILVIPTFVLNELQMIADSADSIKRNRGRRGLDILNKMQKDHSIKVKISDMDFADINEVDAKLVKLAKVMKARVVTNDFNLNKVAEFHGVSVLNINQLSNALKPVVLPGEEMRVSLIKEGKDPNQAIGYLDDGTMIVVENGRKRLHDEVDVTVTSVLQTTAGRMIFARLKADD